MAMRADELAGLHDDLAIDIDRLHLVSTSPDDALPEPRMRAVVNREVLDLCAVLEQHFALEETGVHETVAERGGVSLGAFALLCGDHRRLIGQLRHLAETSGTLPIDVLKLRIADLLDALGEHERAEARLVDVGPHRSDAPA
jgi:hypothetical protein